MFEQSSFHILRISSRRTLIRTEPETATLILSKSRWPALCPRSGYAGQRPCASARKAKGPSVSPRRSREPHWSFAENIQAKLTATWPRRMGERLARGVPPSTKPAWVNDIHVSCRLYAPALPSHAGYTQAQLHFLDADGSRAASRARLRYLQCSVAMTFRHSPQTSGRGSGQHANIIVFDPAHLSL